MLSCFWSTGSGDALDLSFNYSMEDMGDWGVKISTDENLGLDWDVFPSLFFWPSISLYFLSSSRSSSQSEDTGDTGEVGDWAVGASTSWVRAGAWLDAAASASLALSVVNQFLCVALGRGPIFTFLGWESFSLLGLVWVTTLHQHVAASLGLNCYDLLGKGWGLSFFTLGIPPFSFAIVGKVWLSSPQGGT